LDEAMPEDIYNRYILKIVPEDEHAEGAGLEDAADEQLRADLENIEITREVVEEINTKFSDVTLEDAQKIIFEVTNELIADLKADMKVKIKERETALLNELTKSQTKKK
jgi:hypothetical protein